MLCRGVFLQGCLSAGLFFSPVAHEVMQGCFLSNKSSESACRPEVLNTCMMRRLVVLDERAFTGGGGPVGIGGNRMCFGSCFLRFGSYFSRFGSYFSRFSFYFSRFSSYLSRFGSYL